MTGILLIDDDTRLLNPIVAFLERKGYTVWSADDGHVGSTLAKQHQPDVVVCDVMMPTMDGFEVYRSLQADPGTQSIPFIMMSALTEKEDVRRGMAIGSDDYLMKPFTMDELVESIEARLHRTQRITEKYQTAISTLRENIIYALPHELRTALMSVMGYGHMLSTNARELSADEVKSFADEIMKGGERLNRVIENYLVYAQLEIAAGNPEQREQLRNHLVMTGPVICEAAEEVASAYGRETDLMLDLTHIAIRMSGDNLSKIIAELVDNAFKFSERGQRVRVRTRRQGSDFFLEVRDQGRGMTAKQIEDIGAYMQFERRLHEQQGLGLGLAIVQKLVELHGGDMALVSQPGRGTASRLQFSLSGEVSRSA